MKLIDYHFTYPVRLLPSASSKDVGHALAKLIATARKNEHQANRRSSVQRQFCLKQSL